jgi:hypothetical protein
MRHGPMLGVLLAALGAADAQPPLFRAGLGGGSGFGGTGGIGAEAEWKRVALLAGVGGGDVEVSWDAGLRYYFKAPGSRIRPHASLLYGPTHLMEYEILGGPEAGTYNALIYGVNVLGGIDHDFRSPGGFMMSYGLGLAVPGELPPEDQDRIESVGGNPPEFDLALALSIGIKYQF